MSDVVIGDSEDFEDLAINSPAGRVSALMDFAKTPALKEVDVLRAWEAMHNIPPYLRIPLLERPFVWVLSKLFRLSMQDTYRILQGDSHGNR